MSGYLFLAATCVESACILNIINTPLASGCPHCDRHGESGLTSDADRPHLLISIVMFGVRTTNSKVSQQWNDGYDIVSYVNGDLLNCFLCYGKIDGPHVPVYYLLGT